MTVADRLRSKAREYELSKLAAEERGELDVAVSMATAAIVLFEVADAVEDET